MSKHNPMVDGDEVDAETDAKCTAFVDGVEAALKANFNPDAIMLCLVSTSEIPLIMAGNASQTPEAILEYLSAAFNLVAGRYPEAFARMAETHVHAPAPMSLGEALR